MERVVEPELMDEDTQARAYSEANFAEPHDRYVELLAAALADHGLPAADVAGPILDLGCGPADITVRTARRFPMATLHGVDGSAAMLTYGKARIERERLTDRIVLKQALLPRDQPPLPTYPIVMSNSLLHHLHDAGVMWSIIKRYAQKGARVFVMDLMRPADVATVDKLVADNSAGEPEILVKDFHASLCAAFTADEVREQLQAAGLLGLRVDVVSDRHLTVHGVV
ncbi:MAG TPA: class I SAM-dependent methyltransferase [Myxococcota bacterium]|jgi:trans-aconitate methyltransferase